MQAKSRHRNWTAHLVIAGVIDVLEVEAEVRSTPNVCVVKGLFDRLASIGQTAITQQEPKTTMSKVRLVRCRNPICDENGTGTIESAIPACALSVCASLEGALCFGVTERFLFAVA